MPVRRRRQSAFPETMVVYQIYPRSFRDADGNGIGDLRGIESKLDYLQDLGITAVWLSPVYRSPMVDGGYDVVDYRSVDPLFGSLADLDRLIAEAHRRDIRIILDLVVNHTSDQHPWFLESRSTRDNPKRDWYVWKDPDEHGSAPNNWLSVFGGSAWEFDQHTNQYYLHSFGKEQPDLNWENPAVRKAMKDIMRFWFERGVDGFRVDAVFWLGKDPEFRDDLKNRHYDPKRQVPYQSLSHTYSKRGKKLYSYLKELSKVAKTYGNRVLITEAYPHLRFHYRSYLRFYEKVDPAVLAPFNFEGIFLPWDAGAFQRYINGFQKRLDPRFVPVYALSNHDKPRIVTRFGERAARATALLLLSLPGVPVIYYGDEIGMANVPIPEERQRDAFSAGADGNRDQSRTPMQWSAQKYAGFSEKKPWLPIAENYRSKNVEEEAGDPDSILSLYKDLLDFRAQSDALKTGIYKPLEFEHPDLFGFRRETKHEKLAIIINFSRSKPVHTHLTGSIVLSTHKNTARNELKPLEGRIISLA